MKIIIIIILFLFILYYRKKALFDDLTGILNRKTFEKILVRKMLYVKTHKNYCLLYYFIDLDNFSNINNTKGHSKGDRILKNVSNIISNNIRRKRHLFSIFYGDIIGRYGGEEFCVAVLLDLKKSDNTVEKIAIKIGERINKALRLYGECTASIGCAEFHHNDKINVHNLISVSDINMYKAKNSGKDKTIITIKK